MFHAPAVALLNATVPLIFETRIITEAPVGLFSGSEILGPSTGYLKDKQTAHVLPWKQSVTQSIGDSTGKLNSHPS